MMIKAESYKIFSEIYCPIVPAPLELYFGDGCRSVNALFLSNENASIMGCVFTQIFPRKSSFTHFPTDIRRYHKI